MATFDASKDICIKSWANGDVENEANVFVIGVYKYAGGQPKLGMTRTYLNRNTDEIGLKSSGRLFQEDVEFLLSKADEIREAMNS